MAEYAGRYDVGSMESTERKHGDVALIKRLLNDYVLRHKPLVFTVGLLIATKTLLLLIGPLIYKVTIDYFLTKNPTATGGGLADIIKSMAVIVSGSSSPSPWTILLSAGLLYILTGILLWAISSLQEYHISKLGLTIIAEIRSDFFHHLQKLHQNFFEYGNTGKLVSRVTNDAEAMRRLVSSGIIGLAANLVTVIAVLLTMFLLNVQLATVVVGIVPILAVVSWTLRRWVRKMWRIARQNIASMTAKVQDLMYGVKVTKAMTQEERSLREFDLVNESNMRAQIRAEIMANIFEAIVGFFSALVSALIWFFGGQQVITLAQTLGDLVAFTQYSTSLLDPIQSISTFYGEIQSALAGAERIFTVMDIEPEIKEATDAVEFPGGQGILEFSDVSFSYAKDQPVLKAVSFRTKPGERLAIFGPTGAGKSSIINLIGRFYDPEEGHVSIDGIDLRRVRFKSLRQRVSIVLQEPYLFSGTLKYNLKFGRADATDEEVIKVCKLVGIHEPIERLEKGYDEEVREQGSNLSYGQRQLVCLARALIADPKILILDEATSSVDPYTESLIQNALKIEMINRTIIIVTHRVSTVRDADRIIILNEGQIRDTGTHNELVERNTLYSRLCEMQLVSASTTP